MERLPPFLNLSLSARLLALTVLFVMLAEVLIYAPSIGRFRKVWLEERLDAAHLAGLALEATPDGMLDMDLQRRLLAHARAAGIVLHLPDGTLRAIGPDMPARADAVHDLRDPSFMGLIADAFVTLTRDRDRMLRVIGRSGRDDRPLLEVMVQEMPLRAEMLAYSERILGLSLFISLLTAAFLYASLHWLMVRPMRRLTASMTAFRAAPDDAGRILAPSRRSDEIGVAERALAAMQSDLRAALTQKARLAALGAAVTRIHHDLRGILSSALLVSDRLEASDDPDVRRLAPVLVGSIERAAALCTRTLTFVREGPPVVTRQTFGLAALIDEVGRSVTGGGSIATRWVNEVAGDMVAQADRDLLFRVLANLGRNAVEAGAATVRLSAAWRGGAMDIFFADDGPGIPERARHDLFTAFAGSLKAGGSGLGLAIARELMAAQGGDILLVETTAGGTLFRLHLPPAK